MNNKPFDLPIHSRQVPYDIDTPEHLTLGPFGNVEQERIKGQEDEAHAYRVSHEMEILKRPHVDPGGLVEEGVDRSFLRGWIRSAELEAYRGDSADDRRDEPYAGGEAMFGDEVGDG